MTITITPDNIISHELIGLQARVVQSTNPTMAGLHGRIIDETKSMLVMCDTNKQAEYGATKYVAKSTCRWEFTQSGWNDDNNGDNNHVIVDGADIVGRPYERIASSATKRRYVGRRSQKHG